MSPRSRRQQGPSAVTRNLLGLSAGLIFFASAGCGATAQEVQFDPYVFLNIPGIGQINVDPRDGSVSYSIQNPGLAGVGGTITIRPGRSLPWPPSSALWASPTHSLDCHDGTFIFDDRFPVALEKAFPDILVFRHPEGMYFGIHRNGAFLYQRFPGCPVQQGFPGQWRPRAQEPISPPHPSMLSEQDGDAEPSPPPDRRDVAPALPARPSWVDIIAFNTVTGDPIYGMTSRNVIGYSHTGSAIYEGDRVGRLYGRYKLNRRPVYDMR
jgi:hypothetical protein